MYSLTVLPWYKIIQNYWNTNKLAMKSLSFFLILTEWFWLWWMHDWKTDEKFSVELQNIFQFFHFFICIYWFDNIYCHRWQLYKSILQFWTKSVKWLVKISDNFNQKKICGWIDTNYLWKVIVVNFFCALLMVFKLQSVVHLLTDTVHFSSTCNSF